MDAVWRRKTEFEQGRYLAVSGMKTASAVFQDTFKILSKLAAALIIKSSEPESKSRFDIVN